MVHFLRVALFIFVFGTVSSTTTAFLRIKLFSSTGRASGVVTGWPVLREFESPDGTLYGIGPLPIVTHVALPRQGRTKETPKNAASKSSSVADRIASAEFAWLVEQRPITRAAYLLLPHLIIFVVVFVFLQLFCLRFGNHNSRVIGFRLLRQLFLEGHQLDFEPQDLIVGLKLHPQGRVRFAQDAGTFHLGEALDAGSNERLTVLVQRDRELERSIPDSQTLVSDPFEPVFSSGYSVARNIAWSFELIASQLWGIICFLCLNPWAYCEAWRRHISNRNVLRRSPEEWLLFCACTFTVLKAVPLPFNDGNLLLWFGLNAFASDHFDEVHYWATTYRMVAYAAVFVLIGAYHGLQGVQKIEQVRSMAMRQRK